MNAWPKLVSEAELESSVGERKVDALQAHRCTSYLSPDFSAEALLREAWRKIAQERQNDILHSASNLQRALQDLLSTLHAEAGDGLYQRFVDHFLTIHPPLPRLLKTLGNSNPNNAMAFPNTQWAHQCAAGTNGDLSNCSSTLSWNLSRKEVLVLHLIRLGLSNKGIAREMRITPETVKSHIKRIFIKLASKNRIEAVSKATDLGFL